jgi:glutaredoxin
MKQVTLFTKPGCHLCESVEQVIRHVAHRRRFRLSVRNILDDPNDQAAYETAIPVVLVDGVEIARYRLTAHDLEAALAE